PRPAATGPRPSVPIPFRAGRRREPPASLSRCRCDMNESQLQTSGAAAGPARAPAPERRSLLRVDALWTGVARAATIGIFLLLLTGALDLGRTLFLPLVSALVFAFVFGPLQVAAERRHVPAWLFALGCVVALIAIINLIIILT